MLDDTELLNNEWEIVTVGENNPRIDKLKKKMVSPPFKIRVTGRTKAEMLENLEHIEGVFDRDCFLFETTKQMGRLYIGDFYRECLITSSTKAKVFEQTGTTVEYVATSNDGFWRNDSEVVFSGAGMRGNEIAGNCLVSASHNQATMISEPLANGKLHLEWQGGPFVTSYGLWLKFDLGAVMDVETFSGVHIERNSITPVSIDVEISSGERQSDYRNETLTTLVESYPIKVFDFTKIKIDSVGSEYYMRDHDLIMSCYQDGVRVRRILINDVYREWIDVSEYDELTFFGTHSGEVQINMDYTVDEEQWTVVDTVSPSLNESIEVVVEDINCRYIRLRGSYFGVGIDDDVSIISGEISPDRDMFYLQYTTENISSYVIRDDESGLKGIELNDKTKAGYITFADQGLSLKNIYCEYVRKGNAIVQGRLNGEWSNILTLANNTDEDYDTHYDQIRLKFTEDTILQYCHIYVQTDARVYNNSYAPSNAIIEIAGPWNNPSINIANVEYGANVELLSGHRLVIDTKKHRVRDYSDEVSYENVYASRLPDSFTKIETGESIVDWVGSATEIKITLEQARSTPKWN